MGFLDGGLQEAIMGGPVINGFMDRQDRDLQNPYREIDPQGKLGQQSREAAQFANRAEQGFGQMGKESAGARSFLADQMRGKNSLSAEQLRQGLQQQLAMQQSMAAGARPANAAMASRTAMIQGGRAASGMSGQAAMAGIAERTAAANSLNNALAQQRALEMQAALQGRANSIQGYSNIENARTTRYTGKMGEKTADEKKIGFLQDMFKVGGLGGGGGG